MHAVEELIEPPYLYGGPLEYTLIDEDGYQTKKEYITHGFSISNTVQRYDRIANVMDAPLICALAGCAVLTVSSSMHQGYGKQPRINIVKIHFIL